MFQRLANLNILIFSSYLALKAYLQPKEDGLDIKKIEESKYIAIIHRMMATMICHTKKSLKKLTY